MASASTLTPKRVGVVLHRLLGRRVVEEPEALGDDAELPVELVAVLPGIEAEDLHVPSVPLPQPLEYLYRGGLAGPVGAQQGEDLSRLDVKGDAGHGLQAAVVLLQRVDFDDAFNHRPIRSLSSVGTSP